MSVEKEIATWEDSDYNQKDAEGFISLCGLPGNVQAMVDQTVKEHVQR